MFKRSSKKDRRANRQLELEKNKNKSKSPAKSLTQCGKTRAATLSAQQSFMIGLGTCERKIETKVCAGGCREGCLTYHPVPFEFLFNAYFSWRKKTIEGTSVFIERFHVSSCVVHQAPFSPTCVPCAGGVVYGKACQTMALFAIVGCSSMSS